jgi:hypothetical protein
MLALAVADEVDAGWWHGSFWFCCWVFFWGVVVMLGRA